MAAAAPSPQPPLDEAARRRLYLLTDQALRSAQALHLQFGDQPQLGETTKLMSVAASNLGFAVSDWLDAMGDSNGRDLNGTAAAGPSGTVYGTPL